VQQCAYRGRASAAAEYPEHLQDEIGVGPAEEVTFTQIYGRHKQISGRSPVPQRPRDPFTAAPRRPGVNVLAVASASGSTVWFHNIAWMRFWPRTTGDVVDRAGTAWLATSHCAGLSSYPSVGNIKVWPCPGAGRLCAHNLSRRKRPIPMRIRVVKRIESPVDVDAIPPTAAF
jgi:hypothetical protein